MPQQVFSRVAALESLLSVTLYRSLRDHQQPTRHRRRTSSPAKSHRRTVHPLRRRGTDDQQPTGKNKPVVYPFTILHLQDTMGPRWKGKGSAAKAMADPMSKIISQLQSLLIQSNSHGLLSGCSVLLDAEPEQADLLNRSCFGRPIVTAEKNNKQWFQLGMEEAFYLCHSLNCLKIVGEEDKCSKSHEELWNYMKSKRDSFPIFFKAYCHLRNKNWVVKPGSQYGVDYVVYRHHPALVHSEYAVLVISEEDEDASGRLRVWSDFQCTLRLCGSVAKTLLVLYVCKNGDGDGAEFPLHSENCCVKERTITRWHPERNREDQQLAAEFSRGVNVTS